MVESLKNVKLNYFAINGAACIARALLHYGKIDFVDNRIQFQNWPEVKPTMEFQFLPVLEVDGNQLSQAQAIYIYLARKVGNLMGKSDEDEYQIISLLNCISDLSPVLFKLVMPSEEDKKPENSQKNLEAAQAKIKIFASALEKRFEKSGAGKFYLSSGFSLADFWFAIYVGNFIFNILKDVGTTFRASAPKLSAYIDNIVKEEPFKGFFESDKFIKASP